jgi:hypothetical protein
LPGGTLVEEGLAKQTVRTFEPPLGAGQEVPRQAIGHRGGIPEKRASPRPDGQATAGRKGHGPVGADVEEQRLATPVRGSGEEALPAGERHLIRPTGRILGAAGEAIFVHHETRRTVE